MERKFSAEDRQKAAAAKDLRKDCVKLLEHGGISVETAHGAAVMRRCLQIPVSLRNIYVAAVQGDSPTSGIQAFCFECVGWERSEAVNCTVLHCPLHPYRPKA